MEWVVEMGYSNGFALAVRVGGQFVHELANGELHVPFGAVYSLRFKNKHGRCAKVAVRVDGEDVGAWEVPALGSIDIQRPADRDAGFVFASLESDAAYAAGKGGSNPNNQKGLIEATFYLEQQRDFGFTSPNWIVSPSPFPFGITCRSSVGATAKGLGSTDGPPTMDSSLSSYASANPSVNATACTPILDGCTVDGGSTGQQFATSYRHFEAEGTTIKVFLRGYGTDRPVAVPASPSPRSSVQAENARLKQEVAAKRAEKEREAREIALAFENEALRQELAALA